MSSEQISGALLASGVGVVVGRRRLSRPQVCALAVLAAGTILMLAAPGNAARAASVGQQLPSLAIWPLLGNYGSVLASTWPRFVTPLLGGVCLGLACAGLSAPLAMNVRGTVCWSVLMLLAAIGSTLPLAAVPAFAASRTAFVPGLFLVAGIAGTTFALTRRFARDVRLVRSFGLAVATVVVAGYLGILALDLARANALRPQLIDRWQTLSAARGSGADLALRPLIGERPLAIEYTEPSVDRASLLPNVYIAEFFGVHSVRLTPPSD